jgi:hypothetical protein
VFQHVDKTDHMEVIDAVAALSAHELNVAIVIVNEDEDGSAI